HELLLPEAPISSDLQAPTSLILRLSSLSSYPDTWSMGLPHLNFCRFFDISAIMAAGLKTIIALSFVLAIGFLLVILSSALWHKYWPLLVVAIYIIAPLPNWICGRCANPDDFMDSSSNSAMDFGRFMTGFLVLTGIALPVVLAHSGAIEIPAMIMSIVGGLLIYITIISFSMFFQEQEEF
ncbi:Vacuolar protein sorting-associated protein 55, partial [Penicillium taxi]|uniref:Vacuolar protein sorting-associated protein 55 n=1 Tax=Penicillium taxi TaxID=168475 RepID=UPI0025457007